MDYFIQKPDMDTVLTALILGWKTCDRLVLVQDSAPPDALKNRDICCIECGGAGRTAEGNFDHHNSMLSLPPACIQAYVFKKKEDRNLRSLADYVALVDTGAGKPLPEGNGLSLSGIFSGMRLVEPDPFFQFFFGLEIFEIVLANKINPWSNMPLLPEWMPYFKAKFRQWNLLTEYEKNIVRFTTKSGLPGGFLACPLPGVHGLLRKAGYRLSVALFTQQRDRHIYSIAGKQARVDGLLPVLNALEPGWGGPTHGGIIGSSRHGSALPHDLLIDIIKESM